MIEITEFLGKFNVQTIISVGVILWYFTRDIKKEIQEDMRLTREDIKIARAANEQQTKRTDKLYEMFISLLKKKG